MALENKQGPPQVLPDERIVELYWEREEKAIEETDRKYGRYLYTIAQNILRDGMDCEECLNDTYLGAWNAIPPNRPTLLQAFLSKIMRNIAFGRFRKMTAARRVPPEAVISLGEMSDCLPNAESVEEEFRIREIGRILNAYLRVLPERRCFIFICRYYYCDTVSHIAEMLQVSDNTVYRELGEIRKGLKLRLIQEGLMV